MAGISNVIQQLGAEKRLGLIEKMLTLVCIILTLVAMMLVILGMREKLFPLDYIMNATAHVNTTFLHDTMRRLDSMMTNASEYINHRNTSTHSV